MVPSDPATWISFFQLLISIVGVAITVWLALIVQRSAAKITQLEFTRAVRDSWIHIDDVTLRDPSLTELANKYMPAHKSDDPAFGKKRLFLLILLSPLQTTYQAARQGLFGTGGKESIETIKHQLVLFVRDDDAYWVTQNAALDPAFAAVCREVRQGLVPVGEGRAASS